MRDLSGLQYDPYLFQSGVASRALVLMAGPPSDVFCHDSSSDSISEPSKTPTMSDGVEEVMARPVPSQPSAVRARRSPRTIPPFIPSHDVPRGVLFALQALLYYALMLAVMCVAIRSPLMVSALKKFFFPGRSKPHL